MRSRRSSGSRSTRTVSPGASATSKILTATGCGSRLGATPASGVQLLRMLTINVVFTADSVRRLLPFSLSLLQGSGVRLRLVANACAPAEVELLDAVAASDERIDSY